MTWTPILSTTQAHQATWQPITSIDQAHSFLTPQPVAQPESPSFFSNPLGAIGGYLKSGFDQAVNFEKNLFTHPIDTIASVPGKFAEGIMGAAKQSFGQGTQAVSSILQDYQKGTGSTAGDVANLAKLASGVAGVLFSPITGTFEGAQNVPGLKQVADAFNLPFTVAGVAGGYASGKVIDFLPISQQSKDILMQPIKDLSSLAGQVLLGGKIMGKAGDLLKAKGDITPVEAQQIVEEAQAPHVQAPVPPEQVFIKPAQKAGTSGPFDAIKVYRGTDPSFNKTEGGAFFSTDKRFAADYGKVEEHILSLKKPFDITNQTDFNALVQKVGPLKDSYDGTTFKSFKDYRNSQGFGADSWEITEPHLSAIKNLGYDGARLHEGGVENFVSFKGSPPSIPKKLEPLSAPSKIGKSIEAKAVEDKLTEGFKDTAQYDKITIKDQAEKATNLINTSLDDARAVVRGEKPLPGDLKGTALITAMEEHIKANPSADLAYELANSPLVSATSHAAQELRLAAERVPDSATARLMEIKQAREAQVKDAPTKIKSTRSSLKKSTESVNLAKEDLQWEKFLGDIVC